MPQKTLEEQLKIIEEKEAKLKEKKKAIKNKVSKDKRRERTKRLIMIGATVEAKMKELTEQEEYPITQEKLPELLKIIQTGYKTIIAYQKRNTKKTETA